MSKKKLNYTALVVAAVVLVLAACKKPNDNEETVNDPISRIIEMQNIPNSSDIVKIKAIFGDVELASCPFENGGFKLTLPETVDDKDLREGWFQGEFLTISDPKAKIAYLGIYGYSSAEIAPIGSVYLYGENNQFYYWGRYVYADRDFTVTGKYEYNEYDAVDYNCSFKKGWNILYYYTNVGHPTYYITKKPSNVELKWRYSEDSSPVIRFKKEKAYPNCIAMGIQIATGEDSYIYVADYFGNSDGCSYYYDIFLYDDYDAINVVYRDVADGDWQTAISNYPFEKNQAYTVVCSDDGNDNLVFSVVKDGRKSLSSGRKHSLPLAR